MAYNKRFWGTSANKIYEYLLEEINSLRLKPGAVLSEAGIAEKLQSSRTPVREALMALENEGMVIRYPGRGCYVSDITSRDVDEIFDLRLMFEVSALRSAYKLISDEQLDDLERRILALTEKSESVRYFETDRDLHRLIMVYSGNGRLIDFYQIINTQIGRFRIISAMKPARLKSSRLEHLEIIKTLKSRDLETAEAKMAEHINNIRESTKDVAKFLAIEHRNINKAF